MKELFLKVFKGAKSDT